MSALSRDQLLELAAGYALGALSAEEAAAVEAALPGDDALAKEVAAFRETMAVVLKSEPPMAPRAALREEWLRRVRSGETSAGAKVASIRSAEPVRRSAFARWAVPSALAASLTGVAVLGVQLQRTQASLASTAADVERRERQLNTVLEAEGALMVALLKSSDPSGPGVQFFWNVRQGRGIVHAFHLPPAPKGRTYQVWVLNGGAPVPVRVFDSDADGHALVEKIDLPPSPEGFTKVAISVEPSGGSPAPTTTPILVGELLKAGQ